MLVPGETGVNLEFHCFCPKVFSSISPLHLDDRFKELKRRMIVIPCKRVEELSSERLASLCVTLSNWQFKLLDVTAYDWKGFDTEFDKLWNMETGSMFLSTRKMLSSYNLGFTQIRGQIEIWVAQGWLFERPKSSEVKATLLDLGLRQQQGKWIKGSVVTPALNNTLNSNNSELRRRWTACKNAAKKLGINCHEVRAKTANNS